MPSNLTDLMESAVATAPPEPHLAGDILRIAQRDQRRRTTFTAGLAAVAVVAAGLAGYGVTRDRTTSTPEPSSHFRHDRTVDLSRVVPASSLPGYRVEPWTLASVQHLGGPGNDLATYHAVDSTGHLIVINAPGSGLSQGPLRARLYDAPGSPARPLTAPASPGTIRGVPISWIPRFYDADHLIWQSSGGTSPARTVLHITDLQGGHDQVVPASVRIGATRFVATADDVTGGSMWVTVPVQPATPNRGGADDIYRVPFSGQPTKVGSGVSLLDVGAGAAGWMTTHGQVFVQSATGAPPQPVTVPVDQGCRTLPPGPSQSLAAFAVSGSAVALSEVCGSGKQATQQLLVFDLSGHRLARVTGGLPFNLSFAGDTLLFQANGMAVRYDLVTGTLSQLSAPTSRILQPPLGAGSYVLWYDKRGGHVAHFGG